MQYSESTAQDAYIYQYNRKSIINLLVGAFSPVVPFCGLWAQVDCRSWVRIPTTASSSHHCGNHGIIHPACLRRIRLDAGEHSCSTVKVQLRMHGFGSSLQSTSWPPNFNSACLLVCLCASNCQRCCHLTNFKGVFRSE